MIRTRLEIPEGWLKTKGFKIKNFDFDDRMDDHYVILSLEEFLKDHVEVMDLYYRELDPGEVEAEIDFILDSGAHCAHCYHFADDLGEDSCGCEVCPCEQDCRQVRE